MVRRRIGFVLGSVALAALLMSTGDRAAERAEPDRLSVCRAGEWKDAPHKPSILSVELAGTTERLAATLGCWGVQGKGPAQDTVRSELERGLEDDNRFIGAYVLTLAWWGRYGAKRGWTKKVRKAGCVMAGLAATAGVLDLLENCHLARAYDGDTTMAGDITILATAKWLLLLGPIAYTIGMLVVAGGRAITIVLGGATAEMWCPAVPPRGLLDDLAKPKEPTRETLRATKDHTVLREGDELRRQFLQPTGEPWPPRQVGIGLSGGGIRAATYSLGAIQALQHEDLGVVAKARYLVSVSGGGYFATGRQLLRHAEGITEEGGTPPDPFAANAPERDLLRSRQRYLWDTPLDAAMGVGRVLVSILFNLAIIGTLVFLASWTVGWLARRGDLTGAPRSLEFSPGHLVGTAIAAGVLLVAGLVHGVLAETGGGFLSRLWSGGAAAFLTTGALGWFATLELDWYDTWWSVLIAAAGGFGLYLVALALSTRLPRWWTRWLGLTAPALALSAIAVTAASVLIRQSATHAGTKLALDGLVHAGVITLCALGVIGVGVATVTLALGHGRRYWYPALATVNALAAAIAIGSLADSDSRPSEEHVLAVVALGMVLVYAFLDQKRWSPHVFYKKRLATAFMLARLGPSPGAQQMPFAVRTSLSSWMRRPKQGPELVIAATVHTSNPALKRDERVWPFSFTREWVGGPDVGWMRTLDFEAALGRANGGDGSAIAAAAISGAAVASSMGVMSKGSTNAALALANLRLGVWLPSPDYVRRLTGRSDPTDVVTWVRWRRFSYLLKEIVGHFDVQDRFVYVSDGGHLENLGLVELLSRRCSKIVLVDASGDQYSDDRIETAAGTLRTAMRQANIRLGVVFTDLAGAPLLHDEASATGELYRRVGDATDAFRTLVRPLVPVDRVSSTCWIRLRAVYPDAAPAGQPSAEIVLVKSLLTPRPITGSDGAKVSAARDHNKAFPRNSTGNQWLTDELFDGYEALGRQNVAEAAAEILAVIS